MPMVIRSASKMGLVSVRELFDYVCDQVKKATNNKQHPTIWHHQF